MITRNSLKVHVHNQIDCKKKNVKDGTKKSILSRRETIFFLRLSVIYT